MLRKLAIPVIALAAISVMVIGILGSGAWFTDTATNNTATLSSGTLSIDDGKVAQASLGAITNMAPGDKTGDVKIVIENNGNLNLAWFGNLIVGDSPLKDVVYIDYAEMQFLGSDNSAWEPADNFILNGQGHGSWPTIWGGPDHLATLTVFDGNPGMAPGTPYEFMGALKPGFRYELTLRFGFWEGAGNQYQGQGPMPISFQVDATQINGGALEALYPSLGNMQTWLGDQIAKQ